MKRQILISLMTVIVSMLSCFNVSAEITDAQMQEMRQKLYKDYETASGVPWYQIAAVDQYERNTYKFREQCTYKYDTISICFTNEIWSGPENPIYYDNDSYTINLFGGIGKDGDGDGIADINNQEDVLYTMVDYLRAYNDFDAAITAYYQNVSTCLQ